MGRPRLYNTPEEKVAANRAKSKRHYDSHKNSINKKRRRSCRRKSGGDPGSVGATKDSNPGVRTAEPTSPLASWMECVERVHRSLKREVGESPSDYVEAICLSFLKSHDKDGIMEKVVKLSKYQKRVCRYETEVYSLDGVGAEYLRVSEVTQKVDSVVSWVEEILCYAMVDFQSVYDRYGAKAFMFQSK